MPALVEGLKSGNAAVVDVGSLPVPMVYYAARRIKADGCAIITAPFASEAANGLEWSIDNAVPNRQQVEFLRKAVNGKPPLTPTTLDPLPERSLDVSFDYVSWLQDTWFDSPAISAHVVLDPKFGPWAGLARRYLQAVFPRLLVSAIRDSSDYGLAEKCENNGGGDACDPLSEEVDRIRADLGFVLGIDGRCLTLIDGNGVPLQPAELNGLLVQSFGASLENEIFLHDRGCSPDVIDAAARWGAKPMLVESEHAEFWRMMIATSAPLGVDSTGRHFFRAICGNCDALFTICWILDYIAHQGKPFAKIREQMPR